MGAGPYGTAGASSADVPFPFDTALQAARDLWALADEVESAAGLAAQRTAIATAAALARDALRLTPTGATADRARRAALSSDWFMQCGEQADALAVVTPVFDDLPPGSPRARCLVARAIAFGQEVERSVELLREAIR